MSGRNVHKTDAKIFKLPQDAIQEDRGLKSCGTPQLVLASLTDVAPYKNDRTLIGAYKFDSMFVELEDANGVLTDAPGIEVLLPHQSDALAWIIDWRQVVNGLGALAQGCYRVRVNWTKAGNSDWFYSGSYQLLEYTINNAAGTVRLYVVLNDFVRNQGINYKDSGAAGTVRFNGSFGYMQPNYETENNTLTDRTRHKVRIEALRSYELRTDYLHHCMTRLIDEETLLVANQIYISDHNAANHVQYYDFPVILSEDESPSFDYPQGSVFAKITAKFLDKKAWYESKYDGNIQGSTNMILQLPTTVASCAPASYTVEYENGTLIESGTVISGGSVTVEVPNLIPCSGTASISPTGQSGDPNGDYYKLPTGKLNVWGHNWRLCGITGGYTDGTSYFSVTGATTTRTLAFPEGLMCDLGHVDCDGDFPMVGMDGISTTGYVVASVADAYNTAYSTASFPTGFRTPTINELDNWIDFPKQYTYSHKPFEKAQAQWWSQTDYTSGNKFIVINTPSRTFVSAAGASGMSFPVRITNISEL